jgi:hypothetical protein
MSILNAKAGQTVSASVRFTDEDGNPVTDAKTPVTYKVLDPQLRLVLSDIGVQDSVDLSLFTCTFTLPAGLPATEAGQSYRLQWTMKTRIGLQYSSYEMFTVEAAGVDPDSSYPNDVVIAPGAGFVDKIHLHNTGAQPTVSFTIIDEMGRVISTKTPTVDASHASYTVYSVEYTAEEAQALGVPTGVQQHYVANWLCIGGGLEQPQVESHPVYVITPQLQTIMLAIYKMFSDGILENVEPYLVWTAGTIAHHAIKGFEYVNGAGVRVTGFSIATPLPSGLTQYIEKAGMVSALRAQAFAYQADWDFQGAGVQLNVNRASTLSDLIGQLSGDLEKLADAKKTWLNSGQPYAAATAGAATRTPMTTTEIGIGPSTNWAARNIPFDAVMPSFLFTGSTLGPRGGRRL